MALAEQVALVTGGGTGIGRAVALALAAQGATVAIMGRREQPLRATADDIGDKAAASMVLLGDVSVESDVDAAVSKVMEHHGRLDVLVNNAAVYHQAGALDTTAEDWDRLFATNVRGLWLMSKRCVAEMRPGRSGAVINISSTIAQRPLANAAAYCASKAAIEALTKSMALEVARDGVRVNAVVPGIVDTPIHGERGEEAFLAQAGAMHPLGRVGHPEDVAAAVVYLASPAAAWITGSLFVVDGGISLA